MVCSFAACSLFGKSEDLKFTMTAATRITNESVVTFSIKNNTKEDITLTKIDFTISTTDNIRGARDIDKTAYSLSTGVTTLAIVVPANGSITAQIKWEGLLYGTNSESKRDVNHKVKYLDKVIAEFTRNI